LSFWPSDIRSFVQVIPRFTKAAEESFFARSHIFVLPSFFEGQPLALLEAMEAGRCCITTNCCGQKDLIQHGYNGLFHEPGDAQELATLIAQCVNNAKLRMSIGRNAKLSVKNRSWETVSAEVVDRIEEILC
jgi:glycosyltransferase involved in cell wall biosynthesis